MGGGNAQKSAKAREEALKKAAATKTPEERKAAAAKAAQDKEAVKCKICLQGFMCTATTKQLKGHVDSKHAGTDPAACFPAIASMLAAEEQAAAQAAPPKPKKDAPKKKSSKGGDLDALFSEGLSMGKKKK
mmetsp:Transcript_1813/g.3803  ORF Transcript_1813/g.3803 Transcript_1813/m.3803 type:complete len:131 (-) Transcript_1813:207-599(-)|eukprot:CAMPEP_0172608720 /NCGR_PEP_ID=MMETSP1068-20121228/28789_1 /TAXON_ID=35684 /ORGANISM="Pseudopedinella elastica, Strain CCMP716" /LENGTH=130 /DNA_ID=CAMNT_0013412059 /DNA_START=95 /DNA_END=487 /DNA_ORIENTATION=-